MLGAVAPLHAAPFRDIAVVFGQRAGAVQMAFLMATGVSASLNFLGMKFFVFRPATTSGIA